MKRMLINATQAEELRVALVDGQRLYDLDIEATGHEQKKSNIYKAKIMRIEPSLEAAFVNYGAERHGFLPLKEVSRTLFKEQPKSGNRTNIKDVLDEGQEIVVQIEKEERGNKGAALTTFISLAGRYLVAMPNNPRAGGVSRQIEGSDRDEAKEAMAALTIPDDFGLILRTAGIGKSPEELQWDLDYLLQLSKAIDDASVDRKAPYLIYQDQNVIIRAIRDYLRADIAEILVDDQALYDSAHEFMQQVMPQNLDKLKRYDDSVPLFTRYQIESQIQTAFSRTVRLPSGGSIVIEPTEALITIDINSSKATKGRDIEDTALQTNLEAADEIATQLRLRDLGGLIVIDYIDMLAAKNQRNVENRLRDAVKVDRARVQIGRISRFGLLEMSRQRIRPSLAESSHELCPRCEGVGTIRNTKSTGLAVLRIIEEDSMKDSTVKIAAQVPIDVATFLANEKRQDISGIEERGKVTVLIIPNQNLETPHYEIERVRDQDAAKFGSAESHEMVKDFDGPKPDHRQRKTPSAEQPVVKELPRSTPKPKAQVDRPPGTGWFGRILRVFGAKPTLDDEQRPASKAKSSMQNSNRRPSSNNRGRRNSGNERAQTNARGKSETRNSSTGQGSRSNDGNRPLEGRGRQRNQRKAGRQSDTNGNVTGKSQPNRRAPSSVRKERSTENNHAHDNKSDQLAHEPVSVESTTPAGQIQSEAQTEINYNVTETETKPARTENDTAAPGNRAEEISNTSVEQVNENDTPASGKRTEEVSSTSVEQITDTDRAPVTAVENEPKAPPAIKQEDPVQPSMFDREQ